MNSLLKKCSKILKIFHLVYDKYTQYALFAVTVHFLDGWSDGMTSQGSSTP